jgi:L-galactose dehydrogenase
MIYRTLGNTGLSVSILGFGASPLGDVFRATDPAEGVNAVHAAIDSGINFFDVSPYYGLTLAEERLGNALLGRREKVVLATKCGRYGSDSFDFSARRVKASIDESLTRLQTDYVDLLQVHDVEFGDSRQIVNETIPALRAIQREGKARFIGITGYPLSCLRDIAIDENVDTILSYCRYNLMITDLDVTLAPLAKAKGIGLINASPLHMGILTERGAPAWHPAPQSVKDAGSRVVALCRESGVDPSAVALKFCLDYPNVSSTLVGMSSRTHLAANVAALDFNLSPDLVAAIRRVVANDKDTVWPSGRTENSDYVLRQQLHAPGNVRKNPD